MKNIITIIQIFKLLKNLIIYYDMKAVLLVFFFNISTGPDFDERISNVMTCTDSQFYREYKFLHKHLEVIP